MFCRQIALLVVLGCAAPLLAQDKDTIIVSTDKGPKKFEGRVKSMTCDKVQYQIEMEDEKVLNQEEDAEKVEEIDLSKEGKPRIVNQAEEEMENQAWSAAVKSWEKSLTEVKDAVLKQEIYYKRARCLYFAGEPDRAVEAFRELKAAIPDTFYLRQLFMDMYECYRIKGDYANAEKVITEFEGEARNRGKSNWTKRAHILKGQVLEIQGKTNEAAAIYAKYTNERGGLGEDAAIGEIRCLSSAKNWAGLKSKCDSIKSSRKGQPRLLTAAYNGIGLYYYYSEVNLKEALMAFLRGITEFQKDIRATREHETSLAFSAVLMAEYGKTLPEDVKRDSYFTRSLTLLHELQSTYQGSQLFKWAKEKIDKLTR